MEFFSDFTLTIAGKAVATNRTIAVINPATGASFAAAPVAEADHLDAAVAGARAAQPGWRAAGIVQRREALIALAKAIEAEADGFGALFLREQGRPGPMAKGEIVMGAKWLKAVARQDLPVDVVEDSAERRIEIHHEPLGVVAAIVPWNFPFLLAIWKIAVEETRALLDGAWGSAS